MPWLPLRPCTNLGIKRLSSSVDPFFFFKNPSNLSIDNVAQSLAWYKTWTPEDTCHFNEAANWSYQLIKANTDAALLTTVQQSYNRYTPEQQGGPLLFIIIMKTLLHSNDSVVKSLHLQVKQFKINLQSGEDVEYISNMIGIVSERIYYAKNGTLPDDYVQHILAVLKTTSSPTFNTHFEQLELEVTKQNALDIVTSFGTTPTATATSAVKVEITLTSVREILQFATALYREHIRQPNSTWVTKKTRNNNNANNSSDKASIFKNDYAIKLHWFRSFLFEEPKEIELEYIESKLQKADIFTKPLTVAEFLRCRKLTCGW